MAEALQHAVRGRQGDAIEALHRLLDKAEVSFTGWTIPVEPLLGPLRTTPPFQSVLTKLSERTR